jgi:hypothetical protein
MLMVQDSTRRRRNRDRVESSRCTWAVPAAKATAGTSAQVQVVLWEK